MSRWVLTVMLSAGPDAFLGIMCPLQLRHVGMRVHGAQEDGLILSFEGVRSRFHNIQRSLTWFIPAFANNRVGSSYGIVEDEGT